MNTNILVINMPLNMPQKGRWHHNWNQWCQTALIIACQLTNHDPAMLNILGVFLELQLRAKI